MKIRHSRHKLPGCRKVNWAAGSAMYLVSQELNRGAELAEGMLDLAKESLTGTNRKEARMEFARFLQCSRTPQKNISQYLTKMLSSGAMTENSGGKKTAGLLSVSNNLETYYGAVQRHSADCRKGAE